MLWRLAGRRPLGAAIPRCPLPHTIILKDGLQATSLSLRRDEGFILPLDRLAIKQTGSRATPPAGLDGCNTVKLAYRNFP